MLDHANALPSPWFHSSACITLASCLQIPLFGVDVGNGGKSDLGGFVLRPEAFKGDGGLLCAYPYDPHTFNYRCIPPGLSDTCVPGCCCGGSEGAPAWTQGVVGKNAYFQDAYRPNDLGRMLDDYATRAGAGRGYNEVIVSQARWQDRLPWTFEAFFYVASDSCAADVGCERKTRNAYAAFQREYPDSGVPLLTIDPTDWEAPFAEAPKCSMVEWQAGKRDCARL